jgi:adenine-specific DNA methylase
MPGALRPGRREIQMNTDKPRLIEVAFPLKQASLDSAHEKMCHQGHIKGIHIWPARRPLAASRAVLIATLLPDPGDAEERAKILEKLGGHVVPTVKKKQMPSGKIEEIKAEETTGGILHWGRESGPDLEWFREAIRKAYSGRVPKVLDPFAGGGAIPFEAMRMGCEATAIDINPVAWFVLKCTLEYPQKLAGQKQALPEFILKDRKFMEQYFERGLGLKGASLKRRLKQHFGEHDQDGEFHQLRESASAYGGDLQADLAWHVRAWGKWVLKHARKELAEFYPTYATWEPVLETEKRKLPKTWLAEWKKQHAAEIEAKGLRLCPMTPDGEPDGKELNKEFGAEYLAEPTNPRWVVKKPLAYLWARTVPNVQHRETVIPLLKSRWIYKKEGVRILLDIIPKADGSGVVPAIQHDVPVVGGNTAQRREHDRRIGAGTMSRTGVTCPVHGNTLFMEDIRLEARAGRMGAMMTAVVVDGQIGKEFRLPTELELERAESAKKHVSKAASAIPFGLPSERTPVGGIGASRAFSVDGYGLERWEMVFFGRQLATIATLTRIIRDCRARLQQRGELREWIEAVTAYLVCCLDKVCDYNSALVAWQTKSGKGSNTFSRWALPMKWDVVENATLDSDSGGFLAVLDWVTCPLHESLFPAAVGQPVPHVIRGSSISSLRGEYDVIVTDPPYYDAIPYSDLMDFFLVWIRRALGDLSAQYAEEFKEPVGPKWNKNAEDGELIDDASRHDNDKAKSKKVYEEGMAKVFSACHARLKAEGRFVIVFANKQPDAWETLVAAIIKSGFVVDGSWPIQTEMANRQRAMASAALASSVWLVCKKRNPVARPGWDNMVLQQMRERITSRLRDFWDADIRGPDFVWAATGPAMEAYSQYPVVKKANKPNELMSVSEFLRHVRRMVLDFVVGRVLSKATGGGEAATEEMDDVTTYYLLHRNDFGLEDTPAGPCILYCVSCNLSDRDLVDAFDLLVPSGGTSDGDEEEEEAGDDDEEMAEGSSSTFKLKPWNKRKRPGMGYDPVVDSPKARMDAAQGKLFEEGGEKPRTRIIPLIDQIHRLMHLWKAGDVVKVDEYLNSKSLRTNALFPPVLQAVIEMADAGSEERSILESLSNHVQGRSVRAAYQPELPAEHAEDAEGKK